MKFLAMLPLLFAGIHVTGPADNGLTTRTVEQSAESAAADQTQTMSDTWHWGGGITHTVTTVRRDNEDVVAWTKRHKDAVMVAIQYFPPDHQ